MNTTSPQSYFQALNLCTDKEPFHELRPWMRNPFIAGDLAAATNLFVLLYFPKRLVSDIPLEEIPFTEISRVIPSPNMAYPIQLQAIIDAISKAPLVDEKTDDEDECPNCQGEGEVECSECGHGYECPTCKGAGFLNPSKPTGRKIPDDNSLVQLGQYKLTCKILSMLAEVAKILEAQELNIVYQDNNKNLFEVADAYFLAISNMRSDKPVATIEF